MIWKHRRKFFLAFVSILMGSLTGPLLAQGQLKVAEFAPRALAAGATTTVSFITRKPAGDLTLEVSPPEGVSVAEIRPLVVETLRKEFTAWEADLKVETGAAAGNRTLTVAAPGQRSKPEKIEIVPSAPRVSDLDATTKECYLVGTMGGKGTGVDYNFVVLGKNLDLKSIKMTGFGKARSGGIKIVQDSPFGDAIHYLGQAYKTEPAGDGNTRVFCRACTEVRWGVIWMLGVSVEDENGYQSNRVWKKIGANP